MAKDEETVGPGFSKPPFTLTADEVAQELETNIDTGLTKAKAQENLTKYGRNQLDGGEGVAVWEVLFKQVRCCRLLSFAVDALAASVVWHECKS